MVFIFSFGPIKYIGVCVCSNPPFLLRYGGNDSSTFFKMWYMNALIVFVSLFLFLTLSFNLEMFWDSLEALYFLITHRAKVLRVYLTMQII